MATTAPTITVRTNFTPALTVNPLSKSDVTGARSLLLSILQPSIDADFPVIGPVHYAPKGEPSQWGLAALAALLALAAYGAYKLLK